jgi:peptidoglycan/LPS O-acetylase OafA/YrhL
VATIDATRGYADPARPATPEAPTRRAGSPGERGLTYLPGLDGIRAIAVLAVLLYHADVPWMPGGFLGVDMFFVLSGFLITSIVLVELERSGRLSFKRFYLHRARRLLPALLLALALAAAFAAILATDAAATVRRDIVAALTYSTNWVYIVADQSYFEATGRPPLLQHLWSLAVEEQFYLIWPALVVLAWRGGGRGRVREWALIGALISTALLVVMSLMGGYPQPNDGSRVYFGTDSHSMGLLIGAALATVWLPNRLKADLTGGARAIVNAAGFGALGSTVLIMVNSHSNAGWLYWGGFAIFSLLVAVVIAAASHPASALGKVLGTQPLRYIGQRSYGLYLFHWPVFLVLRPELDIPLEGFANFVLRMGITFGLAELSYRYVEMPIRRGALGRWWQDARTLPEPQRRELVKKSAAVGTATLLVFGLVGARLMTIEEETPDYLGGLTEVSALDVQPKDGTAGGDSAGDPQLSGTAALDGSAELKRGVLAVGESVMLGAQGGLRDALRKSAVDAAVGRQAADIVARLRQLRDGGALRETVVLHTGSNGYVEKPQLREMLNILTDAGVPRIVVVNVDVPREWQDPNNELIAELVQQTPNAVLADWHARADSMTGLHVKDGVHLTQRGVEEYTAVIEEAVDELALSQASASQGEAPAAPAEGGETADQAVTAPEGEPVTG